MITFKSVIFDADGTLLDSMDAWGQVGADYLTSLGVTPLPGLSNDLRTLEGLEMARYFHKTYGIREPDAMIIDGINELLEDYYFHRSHLKEGVPRVLEELRLRDIKMCVATATDKYLIEAALQRCDIIRYFGRILTCSEENTTKSSPDIFISAAAYLRTDIRDTLVVEDSHYAIKSAKMAGFPVVAVYDHSSEEHLDEIKSICDCYYETIDGILQLL